MFKASLNEDYFNSFGLIFTLYYLKETELFFIKCLCFSLFYFIIYWQFHWFHLQIPRISCYFITKYFVIGFRFIFYLADLTEHYFINLLRYFWLGLGSINCFLCSVKFRPKAHFKLSNSLLEAS